MRKMGIALVVLASGLLLYTSLAAPAYARTNRYLGPEMLAAYPAPWPIALGCTVSIAGMMLAIVPLRCGERWAMWTLLAIWIVPLLIRFRTDLGCLLVLDPHQHGCHTSMITTALGIIGVILARNHNRLRSSLSLELCDPL